MGRIGTSLVLAAGSPKTLPRIRAGVCQALSLCTEPHRVGTLPGWGTPPPGCPLTVLRLGAHPGPLASRRGGGIVLSCRFWGAGLSLLLSITEPRTAGLTHRPLGLVCQVMGRSSQLLDRSSGGCSQWGALSRCLASAPSLPVCQMAWACLATRRRVPSAGSAQAFLTRSGGPDQALQEMGYRRLRSPELQVLSLI